MRLLPALPFLATLVLAAPASAQLTIRLTSLPPGTPAGATVHVAGSFNGWNPGAAGWTLAPRGDGSLALTLPDSVRGAVEFKLTLGSWDRVETTATGEDVPNRTATVPSGAATTYEATVAAWRRGPVVRPSSRTKSVRVATDSFAIPQLGRTRRVWVYLPPDYATSRRRYAVLYMHDGQNVFDAATSGFGEWGVDETLDSLHARGDRGVIVVAVDHGGDRRLDEYDPWRNPNPKYGGGEGDAYVDFLARTLKPWVDRHYRTRPDAAHTGIMGSSMGGLISLYATLKYPTVFGRAGVFSCACWIADPQIFAYARRARPGRPLPRLYFVSGAFETPEGQPANEQRRIVDSLVAAGFPLGRSVRALAPEDGKHSEWFWRREFPAAYQWLFAEPPGAPAPCRAAAIDSATARRLVDHIERAHGRTPDPRGYPDVQSATAALVHRGRCLTAVTLSHDGERGGGVAIVDPRRPDGAPLAAFDYPGAVEPFAAGAGRLGVTYTHVRGRGLYESRLAVVCALDDRVWAECLSVTRDMITTAVGAGATLQVEQQTAVALRGDTLVLRRTVTAEREGDAPRPPTRSVSRLVLPTVPREAQAP